MRYYIRLRILANTLRFCFFLNIVNSHIRDNINSTKFYRDTDYHVAGQTATGEIGCFIMETMRLVPSNVTGARVSRFPRRKRGINSQASVVRRRSRRWYLAFKSELFTLFSTSPVTRRHLRTAYQQRMEGTKRTSKGEKREERCRTRTYLNKGRCPRRTKNPGFVFSLPLSHFVLSLIGLNVIFYNRVSTSTGNTKRKKSSENYSEQINIYECRNFLSTRRNNR